MSSVLRGAPFVAWFSVPRDRFRFVSGQPARFQSTPKATRSFCPSCGTQLDHIHTSSQLGWIRLADGLPAYPERRS